MHLIFEILIWLKAKYKARQIRLRWTPEMQLEHLRQIVMSDHRWLAHDKVASALTERYMAALDPQWYQKVHLPTSTFREKMGLVPKYGRGLNPNYQLTGIEKDDVPANDSQAW